MTIGGSLKVAQAANPENKFTVTFSRNVEITNYRGREFGKEGDVQATVKNGAKGVSRRAYSNGTGSDLETFDLNSKRYTIFNELRKLDGNSSDLSEKDLTNADGLVGKYGITNIRRDKSAGVTTIVCDDGAVLRFDFETDSEMQARKKKEAVEAPKVQKTSKKRPEKEASNGKPNFLDDPFGWFADRWLRH